MNSISISDLSSPQGSVNAVGKDDNIAKECPPKGFPSFADSYVGHFTSSLVFIHLIPFIIHRALTE